MYRSIDRSFGRLPRGASGEGEGDGAALRCWLSFFASDAFFVSGRGGVGEGSWKRGGFGGGLVWYGMVVSSEGRPRRPGLFWGRGSVRW